MTNNTSGKGDFDRVWAALQTLAEAQVRTEARVGELAEAQVRTEAQVRELAEAQRQTAQQVADLSRALGALVQEHADTRRQLGGISTTIGYTLANEAFKALPELLFRDFGLSVSGRLKRDYVTDRTGRSIEVNILGTATKDGRELGIVGEAKSQLSQNDVNAFIRRKLNRVAGIFPEIFPVMITHMTTAPYVDAYARAKGIALYYSYDF